MELGGNPTRRERPIEKRVTPSTTRRSSPGAYDDHNPPHFHVVGADFQVQLRISDFSVLAGEARPAMLAEALEWAALHRSELALKWAELNERG